MNYLDLSTKKLELDKTFASVINKIPDLCHPAIYRLENENDYFNQTKDFKMEPFRKQEVFERCVTPTQDDRRHEAVSSPTGDHLNLLRPRSCASNLPPQRGASREPGACKPKSRLSPVEVASSTGDTRDGTKSRSGQFAGHSRPTNKQESFEKYQLKINLNHRYSRLRLSKRTKSFELESRYGLDRTCIEDLRAKEESCPFANPIPECMLTSESIDDLRQMIVSSSNIEWRMLTPVRPASDYEEMYFDKLVRLYRNRCEYRRELAACSRRDPSPSGAASKLPFKHIRHGVFVQNQHRQSVLSSCRHSHSQQNCLCLGAKLRGRFVSHRRASTKSAVRPALVSNMSIPVLLLTADGKSAGELLAARGDDEDDKSAEAVGDKPHGPSGNRQSVEDPSEFSYEHFSRFSRRSLMVARGELTKSRSETQLVPPNQSQQQHASDDMGLLPGDTLLDGQIEDIMSTLLSGKI